MQALCQQNTALHLIPKVRYFNDLRSTKESVSIQKEFFAPGQGNDLPKRWKKMPVDGTGFDSY